VAMSRFSKNKPNFPSVEVVGVYSRSFVVNLKNKANLCGFTAEDAEFAKQKGR
jgi:hypothetical protein